MGDKYYKNEIKEKIEDIHEDVKKEIDELKAKLEKVEGVAQFWRDKAENYRDDLIAASEAFFNKYKVPVIVAGAVLVVVAFTLGALAF